MSFLLDSEIKLGSEALRLIHGRGNCVAGAEDFNIEWLPPLALIVSYQSLPEDLLDSIVEQLSAHSEVQSIYLQQRELHKAPFRHLSGDEALPTQALEHGLAYRLELGKHQNFGLFLDMAKGREWVLNNAQGAKVLNLFSYTCAFSVAALAGGAELAVNLDMSRAALNVGRDNLRLNGLDTSKAKFFAHDLFKSWGKLRKFGPYDLVIADPPSLQLGSFDVEKDYVRIIRQLPRLLAPGATAMLCLNAPWLKQRFLLDAVAQEAPQLSFVEALARPERVLEQDQDAGLKVLLFKNAN